MSHVLFNLCLILLKYAIKVCYLTYNGNWLFIRKPWDVVATKGHQNTSGKHLQPFLQECAV